MEIKNELKFKKRSNGFKYILIKTMDIRNTIERLKQMNKKGSLVRKLLKNKTEDEKKLDLFLDTIPISTNYIISESLKLFGIDKKMYKLITSQTEAYDSIGYHIETRNLTDECLIGLSEGQYQMYLNLCNLIE